jgi:hypothetical protein
MSLLNEIIEQTTANGKHEQPIHALVLGYFNSPDAMDRIKNWATENGFKVSFSDQRQTCTFQVGGHHAK